MTKMRRFPAAQSLRAGRRLLVAHQNSRYSKGESPRPTSHFDNVRAGIRGFGRFFDPSDAPPRIALHRSASV